jgi:polysaccharide export outer membrane protein
VIAASPASAHRFRLFHRSRPAADTPDAATARTAVASDGMAVIASSWRPIARTDPEPQVPAAPVAQPSAPLPDAALRQTAAAAEPTGNGPWHPVVLASVGRSGPSATADAATVQALAPTELPPGERIVPHPVPPPPPPGPAVAPAPYHYPFGVHGHAAAPPPIPPVPREFEKQSLPPYVVEPPDILLIAASNAITLPTQPLVGQHLVRPDGTINLGIYGSIYVAGMTLEQIQDAVAAVLHARHARRRTESGQPNEKEMTLDEIKLELQVDVLAYNSKVYYVITDGGGYGEQVYRISATGNETVLDAIAQINGLPAVASKKKIWVARATPDHAPPLILPVDWCGIVKDGSAGTNYQIFPGDRIYVNSDARIRTDSNLAKFLSPIDRVLGTVLLGSSTVNSIKNGGSGSNGRGVP